MTDVPSRIDAAMQQRAREEEQGHWSAFVSGYGLNLLFPARVVGKDRDDGDDDEGRDGGDRNGRRERRIKTNKDLVNARLLENGILFEDLQSLPQLQEGVARAVDNLMRTQAFHGVEIQVDKNPRHHRDHHRNGSDGTSPADDGGSSGSGNEGDDADASHPHILRVILDEKKWYSLYVGGGIKHEGMEEAMNGGITSSRLPKAQFETTVTLPNLTGFLDRTVLQYTIDQTSTSRLSVGHERPLYSWFPEESAVAQSILALRNGSQYSLGIRGLADTFDYESTRSCKEHVRLVQWRLDNVGGVTRPEMAPGGGTPYWAVDWTLCLRDVVPRRHATLPYAADASREVVAQSGPSLQHSVRWEVRTNGCYTDDRYQPTAGLDAFAAAEVAGPPGDVGYAKAHGGTAVHVPLTGRVSVHATCAGGVLYHLPFGGWCRPPTISDRFFVGGPLQLRGFLPAGVGPRSRSRGGRSVPGGDAMGGDLYCTASLAASVVPPVRVLEEYGIRLFAFANAGTLVGMAGPWRQQQPQPMPPSLSQVAMSTRTAAGVGISGGTPMGRVELTYAWPLRYGPRDARRNLQFGFGFSFG